jgi:hypothetical protein
MVQAHPASIVLLIGDSMEGYDIAGADDVWVHHGTDHHEVFDITGIIDHYNMIQQCLKSAQLVVLWDNVYKGLNMHS